MPERPARINGEPGNGKHRFPPGVQNSHRCEYCGAANPQHAPPPHARWVEDTLYYGALPVFQIKAIRSKDQGDDTEDWAVWTARHSPREGVQHVSCTDAPGDLTRDGAITAAERRLNLMLDPESL